LLGGFDKAFLGADVWTTAAKRLITNDRSEKGGNVMGHVQNCACRRRGSVRVRLVVPGLPLWGVLSVLLVGGVALWPAARNLHAQEQEKVQQLLPPPAPPAVPAPAQPPQTQPALQLLPGPGRSVTAVPAPVQVPATGPTATTVVVDGFSVNGLSLSPARRFKFTIDPKTPLKDLLPIPPQADERPVSPLVEDLARVPEIAFQQPLARDLPPEKAQEQTALTIARINHLNKKTSDHFMEALLEARADLAGLPVAMGEACRSTGERSREFKHAVAMVRQALQPGRDIVNVERLMELELRTAVATKIPPAPKTEAPVMPAPTMPHKVAIRTVPQQVQGEAGNLNSFWERYTRDCASEDLKASRNERGHEDTVTCARIAALMQVLAPESPALRLGLVKYLAGISHAEATRALARLALFSSEDEVRASALDALKVRRERDYTAILLQGLRYPLPVVARRASEAMVKLERTDLVAQLVDLLDEPDPRAPVVKEVNNKRMPVVRELVRINHHKNCLLCHAPGNTSSVSPESLTAAVPVPSEPLPGPFQGYESSSPDLLVRVDVTYLRQDFW